MAENTPQSLRNLVIYEIFVRNHGPHGNFADIEADLNRIKDLGVDIIWFMPIHPIGEKARKGSLGSPYSIANYKEVNPEYGSREEFKHLIDHAHQLGLRVMIDVVFNHTAHDSNLVQQHPDWYHQNDQGIPTTTVPEWSDIIDLAYPNEALEAELLSSLLSWVALGLDGFRCDVASIVPLRFWLRARSVINQTRPDFIWLAESVHASFIGARRENSLTAFSDSEVYQAFDLEYDYDIWPIWQAAVTGQAPLDRYFEMLRYQNSILPVGFIKMRCVENHDQARIMALAPSYEQALAWTAFQAFNKGPFLIYAGEESAASHTPSLFDEDKVHWGTYELQPFLTALTTLKKEPIMKKGVFTVFQTNPVVLACWEPEPNDADQECLLGIFNVTRQSGYTEVFLPEGDYANSITGDSVAIRNGQMPVPTSAAVLRYVGPRHPGWFQSSLLDFNVYANFHEK